MTENKRYEFDVMNGGGYVVGYSERMSDDISLIFTRLCEVPTKTQAEKVCNELKGLQKENKQLKLQYSELEITLMNNQLAYNDLKEENEQLKSVVKEVIELLSEEVDVFSDKATEHDLNAYIELRELDNKDAYYMATATKKAIKLLKRVADE